MQHNRAERDRLLSNVADMLRQLEAKRSTAEPVGRSSTRRGGRRSWPSQWYAPGPDTPWPVFGVRLGFWLLLGAGVQTASTGDGWHPDLFAASLGLAEVAWRARRKLRARRSDRKFPI